MTWLIYVLSILQIVGTCTYHKCIPVTSDEYPHLRFMEKLAYLPFNHLKIPTPIRLLIIPPGIYANGYIVFVFPFVCSFVCLFVRTSFRSVEFAPKFCVKVSQVVYISATTYQKAFIFGP